MSGSATLNNHNTATLPPKRKPAAIRVSARLAEAARMETTDVLRLLDTSASGLTAEAAATRLEQYGPNEVASERRTSWVWRLLHTTRNPLVILLSVLAAISYATSDARAGTMMLLMVVLGVVLRFVQESKADTAAAKLKAMIRVTASVVREGKVEEVPLHQLVSGDVVKLSAGDMVPADVRLIASKDLFLTQATLTGESMPVEKFDTRDVRENTAPLELSNLCFLGSMARSMASQPVETSFDKGVRKFTWLMIRFMMAMVPLVFVINGLTKHDWREAFFFAMAVAVGLTPEMLPMIVSVCLSKGALAMSRKKVIVKRLNSIQNFGAMDVLCTDKTGTLTIDHVILELHVDVFKNESEAVLRDAYLISHFQTGLKNVLDRAVLKYKQLHGELG